MKRLPEIEAVRLRKIVGLFDSPIQAEAVAAFNAARSLANRCGIPLAEALTAPLAQPFPSYPRERDWSPEPVVPTREWMRKVTMCRDAVHLFSADAREFLRNLSDMRRAPSPAQLKWLDDLHARAVRHFCQERAA